jgi:predicted RNA-binding Zn-ribbon protein involved in translation (DUF1610 family)
MSSTNNATMVMPSRTGGVIGAKVPVDALKFPCPKCGKSFATKHGVTLHQTRSKTCHRDVVVASKP